MRKKLRIIVTIIILFSFISLYQNQVLAAYDWAGSVAGVGGWNNRGDGKLGSTTTNIFGGVISIIQVTGTGISIIMLLFLAIKYMLAAPAAKTEIKKSAVPLIVGAIIIFSATNLLVIISEFATDNIKSSNATQTVQQTGT